MDLSRYHNTRTANVGDTNAAGLRKMPQSKPYSREREPCLVQHQNNSSGAPILGLFVMYSRPFSPHASLFFTLSCLQNFGLKLRDIASSRTFSIFFVALFHLVRAPACFVSRGGCFRGRALFVFVFSEAEVFVFVCF